LHEVHLLSSVFLSVYLLMCEAYNVVIKWIYAIFETVFQQQWKTCNACVSVYEHNIKVKKKRDTQLILRRRKNVGWFLKSTYTALQPISLHFSSYLSLWLKIVEKSNAKCCHDVYSLNTHITHCMHRVTDFSVDILWF